MSGFLQRLVTRSRPTSAGLGERAHAVRPRTGSRFEPAVDVSRHEEDAVSGESPPAPPGIPDAHQSHEESARTISPPQPETIRTPEPPKSARLERAEHVEPPEHADETAASGNSQARREVPAPPEVRPQQQPARNETEPPDEELSSRERRRRPAREAQPAQSVQPMQTSTPPPSELAEPVVRPASPPERTETVVKSVSPAEDIIRTVRVVQEAPVSAEMVEPASAPAIVQPASEERRPAVRQRSSEMQPPAADQSVTLESQTPLSPADKPHQPVRPVRVRPEHSEESIRPQVPALAPVPEEQQHSVGRRQPAEPPTIKVTIGRIEVRAEQPSEPPPTQPRRQPARRTPALSLDDYLAKRNEGGR